MLGYFNRNMAVFKSFYFLLVVTILVNLILAQEVFLTEDNEHFVASCGRQGSDGRQSAQASQSARRRANGRCRRRRHLSRRTRWRRRAGRCGLATAHAGGSGSRACADGGRFGRVGRLSRHAVTKLHRSAGRLLGARFGSLRLGRRRHLDPRCGACSVSCRWASRAHRIGRRGLKLPGRRCERS